MAAHGAPAVPRWVTHLKSGLLWRGNAKETRGSRAPRSPLSRAGHGHKATFRISLWSQTQLGLQGRTRKPSDAITFPPVLYLCFRSHIIFQTRNIIKEPELPAMRPSLLPPLLSSPKIPGSSSPVPRAGPAGRSAPRGVSNPAQCSWGCWCEGRLIQI